MQEATVALGLSQPNSDSAPAAVEHVQALAAETATPASALEAAAGSDRVGVAVAAAEHSGYRAVSARVATITSSLRWVLTPRFPGSADGTS